MSTITESELLAAVAALLQLERPEAGDPRVFTSTELAAHLGCSTPTAIAQLRPLVAAGRVQAVKTRRQRIDGQWQMQTGYRLATPVPA